MTSRSAFLMFAALLLTASLAGASTPALPAADTPDFMTPALSMPGCSQTELPQLNPSPTVKATGTCGSCSQPICQGATLGTICKVQGGAIYKCTNVYGNLCTSSPITHDCSCWYGPLP